MRKAIPPESECNHTDGGPYCKLVVGDGLMQMDRDGTAIDASAMWHRNTDAETRQKLGSGLSNLPLSFGFSKEEVGQCFLDARSHPQDNLPYFKWDVGGKVKHKDFILYCGLIIDTTTVLVKEQLRINTSF